MEKGLLGAAHSSTPERNIISPTEHDKDGVRRSEKLFPVSRRRHESRSENRPRIWTGEELEPAASYSCDAKEQKTPQNSSGVRATFLVCVPCPLLPRVAILLLIHIAATTP